MHKLYINSFEIIKKFKKSIKMKQLFPFNLKISKTFAAFLKK
jgi:hypothetical protein